MLVFFSSSEIYGPGCDPMDEATADPKPNNRYGLSKFLGEKLLEYEVMQYGLRAVVLRPFMIYDENEDLGDHRSAMIRFAYNLARGRPIEVHDGAVRGWLHVSDAVRAIKSASRLSDYAVINIGHPDLTSISGLAEMIGGRLGADPKLINVRTIPDRMTPVKRPTLDRMTKLLGIEAKISLQAGVARVCQRVLDRIRNGERAAGETAQSD